ncbi:hypothetical protein MLD38_007055 [Melastoma candidum]|uniref:Uncharacterized protein n=1 Tax=Melastoma candidum TaxID=119954 RepID=A0ACB9RPL0_9MYRT|nr:hypothetical protein MLD38_007055 [Melastoma candidum]
MGWTLGCGCRHPHSQEFPVWFGWRWIPYPCQHLGPTWSCYHVGVNSTSRDVCGFFPCDVLKEGYPKLFLKDGSSTCGQHCLQKSENLWYSNIEITFLIIIIFVEDTVRSRVAECSLCSQLHLHRWWLSGIISLQL